MRFRQPCRLSIIDQITHHALQKVYWMLLAGVILIFPAEDIHHSDRVRVNSSTNSMKDPQTDPRLKIFHVLRIPLQIS